MTRDRISQDFEYCPHCARLNPRKLKKCRECFQPMREAWSRRFNVGLTLICACIAVAVIYMARNYS